jgi:hypothetical protein
MGQYEDRQGVLYGGTGIQEETRVMMDLYRQHLPGYQQVLLLDIHSGYGEQAKMSLVNSCSEPRASSELAERFEYDNVVASDSNEFYAMHGDMLDWLYRFAARELEPGSFFGTCFEFGTFGVSTLAAIRSLRAVVLENQAYWHGTRGPRTGERVSRAFQALFLPRDAAWRQRALSLARKALDGILRAEGFILQ